MENRQTVRRIPYQPPLPLGIEVMTYARLRDIAPEGLLESPQAALFHLLILPTAGEGTHTVDFKQHRLLPARTLWVRPGQVHRFGQANVTDKPAAFEAELVLFQTDFLIPNTLASLACSDRFRPVALDHTPTTRALLQGALGALAEEYGNVSGRKAAAARTETLRHLLSVLILRIGLDEPTVSDDKSHDVYWQFRELVERDFAIAHDVNHYARTLGYSPRTLARAAQSAVGQRPKQTVQDRLALEARRMLAHSRLPISTIATRLGFTDASNFSTFFVQQCGQSPTDFRNQQRAS